MTPAGQRDRRIVFRLNGPTKSDTGEMVSGPGEVIAKPYASVNYGRGGERRQAAAESAEITATARILATAKTRTIAPTHIAELDGAKWNVASVAPWGRGEIDITLVRRS